MLRSSAAFFAVVALAGCSSSSEDDMSPRSVAALRSDVEQQLPLLAKSFQGQVPSSSAIYSRIEGYLNENPDFFGSTFSVDPTTSGYSAGLSPYVFRSAGKLVRKDLAQVVGYTYVAQDWYAEPKSSGNARWSAPYFDEGGGDIDMITYSVPIFSESGAEFIGVVTTDVGITGRY